MCDAFETGRCPVRILVTSNAICFRQLVQFLRDNFILFDEVSFSPTEKGILLFSTQDREECDALVNFLHSQAQQFANCFHEYVLNTSLGSNQNAANLCECDSTS